MPPAYTPAPPAGSGPYPPQAPAGYPPPGHYPAQPYAPQYPPQPYPQQAQYPAGPYAQPYPPMMQPAPQVVIHNTAVAAGGYGAYGLRKRNSVALHLILFFFTAGIGNLLYAWYVFDWNRKRGF
jgi:hypothetical protein